MPVDARTRLEATTATLQQPCAGRVHSALLGEKDYYAVDKAVSSALETQCPMFVAALRAGRHFLLETGRYLATDAGVGQFLELGSGYPASPNLHEEVGTDGESLGPRVVYVDDDEVVASHGRACLSGRGTRFVQVDITDTAALVQQMRETLNLTEPVAVCLNAVGEFLADPGAVVDAVTDVLVPGSYLVLCHMASDLDVEEMATATRLYEDGGIAFTARDRAQVEALLARYDLLDPGLTAPHLWHPRHPDLLWAGGEKSMPACSYAAVGQLR